ncbi:UDP-glucose 6-dehydrogenase TuaD [Methyloligella halotolerans]|uniref:UDP-glucose 6-dehydrogenase n=1 Tax=Methyloligella halotolerans TaxID=1177755 RepID=A0A1E2S2X7_9HYPH|nr:UDP-glucose/GDP-mannose dehydrogenase family protein [Methyloligella halotolerans]ODA68688.1 UDP-glucose 6-dehydrogenase TuaD [Methyloligella halotolerans]
MKICMLGAGYVGLVSAACFADFGWDVICVDNNAERVADLERGRMPIYEPGLDDLIERNVKAGRIRFTIELEGAVKQSELVLLAVGTPMRRGSGYADLSYIFEAVKDIAPHLQDGAVITTKSTVPVGTSREIERRLRELRPDIDFAVCSNPEFLREGSAIRDFMFPDRVLVGCDSERGKEVMEALYKPLSLRSAPVMFVERESAELAKYAANAFLAMKVSFINEIADLCEKVDADVQQVADAIGADKRIGPKFLHAGPGYGGSCFPKDVSALIRTAREAHAPVTLVEQVDRVNNERKISMASRIQEAAGGELRDKTVAVLGVTFKPNTDDMREAPSLTILPMLQDRGAAIRAYDPEASKDAEEQLPGVVWCENALSACEGADVLLVLTEWNEFRALNLSQLKEAMRGDVLVDLRNVYSSAGAEAAGFRYSCVGRGRELSEQAPLVSDRDAAAPGDGEKTFAKAVS